MNTMHGRMACVCTIGLMAIIMLAACGSEKYDEVAEVFSEQVQLTENYVNDLESAQDADDVVAAINDFSEGLKALVPKFKKYQNQFPEIWAGRGEIPEEIKAQQERLKAASGKVQAAMMNLMKYMTNPKVQAAMENMGREMSQMK